MNNEDKQARFDDLMMEGELSAEQAMLLVTQEGDEETGTEGFNQADLFAQLRSHDYSVNDAMDLVALKAERYEAIMGVMSTVKIARSMPIRAISGWDGMTEEARLEALWTMGFDVRNFAYVLDVGCFRYGSSKVECGEFIYGSERLDVGWLNLVIEGCNVATIEARFHADGEVLRAMRPTKN